MINYKIQTVLIIQILDLSFDFTQDGEQFGPERFDLALRPKTQHRGARRSLTAEGLVEPFGI